MGAAKGRSKCCVCSGEGEVATTTATTARSTEQRGDKTGREEKRRERQMAGMASLGTPLRLVSRSPLLRLKETAGALCSDSSSTSLQTLFSETSTLTGYVQRALVLGENWLLMGKGDARTKKGKVSCFRQKTSS